MLFTSSRASSSRLSLSSSVRFLKKVKKLSQSTTLLIDLEAPVFLFFYFYNNFFFQIITFEIVFLVMFLPSFQLISVDSVLNGNSSSQSSLASTYSLVGKKNFLRNSVLVKYSFSSNVKTRVKLLSVSDSSTYMRLRCLRTSESFSFFPSGLLLI